MLLGHSARLNRSVLRLNTPWRLRWSGRSSCAARIPGHAEIGHHCVEHDDTPIQHAGTDVCVAVLRACRGRIASSARQAVAPLPQCWVRSPRGKLTDAEPKLSWCIMLIALSL